MGLSKTDLLLVLVAGYGLLVAGSLDVECFLLTAGSEIGRLPVETSPIHWVRLTEAVRSFETLHSPPGYRYQGCHNPLPVQSGRPNLRICGTGT